MQILITITISSSLCLKVFSFQLHNQVNFHNEIHRNDNYKLLIFTITYHYIHTPINNFHIGHICGAMPSTKLRHLLGNCSTN
jgi:hypothetical protein